MKTLLALKQFIAYSKRVQKIQSNGIVIIEYNLIFDTLQVFNKFLSFHLIN